MMQATACCWFLRTAPRRQSLQTRELRRHAVLISDGQALKTFRQTLENTVQHSSRDMFLFLSLALEM
jgi:hypothetical protein